jgi:pimeloyl-ACP methyl ester carboxylesterase
MRALTLLLMLVAILGAWTWWQNPERVPLDDAARAQAPMSFVALPDGITAFRLEGRESGPLVVLIHGYSYPSSLWSNTAAALQAAGFRTLRYDLYGRGWSDRPPGRYDLDRFTQQLEALLDALAPDTPVQIVGLSMGGLIAADFARRHPQRVQRLALLAPFNTERTVLALQLPLLGEAVAHVAYFPAQASLQAQSFHDPALAPQYLAGFTEQRVYKGYRRALLSTLRNLIARDPTPVYEALGARSLPTLLLWGREDAVVPAAEAEPLLSRLGPSAQLQWVADAGHLPQLEQPGTTHEALLRFLRPSLRSAPFRQDPQR